MAGEEEFLGPRQAYISNRLVPEWIARQQRKAQQYGDDNHAFLGERGQFSDIWRKIGPLKRALWEGEDTSDWPEPPREILMDLIGHCFLTIELLDRQAGYRPPEGPPEYVTVSEGWPESLTGPRSAWCRMMTTKELLGERQHTHELRCLRGWTP